MTEGAGSVDQGSKKDESGSEPSTSATGSSIGASGLLTFAQFRSRKEEDRLKHFRNKPGKKLRLEGNADCQTKINIGVMIMKEGRLSIKRGYSLLINVTPNITSEEL